MICRKCGNEIEQGDEYCGICGTKIRNDEPIKIKFNYWLIGISLITVVIIIGVVVFAINKRKVIDITNMLENSENGIYLKKNTVKAGISVEDKFNEYDELISYSAIYENNEVVLEAGGLLLLDKDTNTYKIINLDTGFTAILYNLNKKHIYFSF